MNTITRKKTQVVHIGTVSIGGENPIAVQSMTNTYTGDVKATIEQIKRLEECGCEIIRVAVPDESCINALPEIKKEISIPLIADIHFRADLAVRAIEKGVDKIRINPGNIGGERRLKSIVTTAKEYNVPIRIGVNAGSLPKEILSKYGKPTAEGLVETVSSYISFFEKEDFYNLVVSLKSFDIEETFLAYKLFSEKFVYPTHIGITESGPIPRGVVRSSLGIAKLLQAGLGDTLRVSLAAPPEEEIAVAYEILRTTGVRLYGPFLIACPTCARTDIDIIGVATQVDKRLVKIKSPLKVAVMGCEVNGPGEAKMADVGLACGKNGGVLFVSGQIVDRVTRENMIDKLMEKVKELDKKYPRG